MMTPEQMTRISTIGLERCMEWHPGGIKEWRPSDWIMALNGEAGELAQAVLIFHYLGLENHLTEGDMLQHRSILHAMDEAYLIDAIDRAKSDLAKETADVYLYLDLVAQQFDTSLTVLVEKWRGAPLAPDWPQTLLYKVMEDKQSVTLMVASTALNARVGAIGNIGKKLRRIEDKMRQTNAPGDRCATLMMIGYEIRNTYYHLELMAEVGRFDLHEAIVTTFNKVSERESFKQRL